MVVEKEIGIAVLVLQEKWDKMKEICGVWLQILRTRNMALDYKQLQSNRGFMVYVSQAYPLFKPYLKGFHLSLETWHGGRDSEGWKMGSASKKDEVQARQSDRQTTKDEEEIVPEESQEAFENQEMVGSMDEFKLRSLIGSSASNTSSQSSPPSGLTIAVLCFQQDLEAILMLAQSQKPILRQI